MAQQDHTPVKIKPNLQMLDEYPTYELKIISSDSLIITYNINFNLRDANKAVKELRNNSFAVILGNICTEMKFLNIGLNSEGGLTVQDIPYCSIYLPLNIKDILVTKLRAFYTDFISYKRDLIKDVVRGEY